MKQIVAVFTTALRRSLVRSFKRQSARIALPLLIFLTTVFVHAERLPLKIYTTADGLPHNSINKIVRDSRGFLWFCTGEGLSRFDGYTFTNYGTNDGLPHAVVTDILETLEGDYWVATYAGLAKFNPRGVSGGRVVYANDASAGTSNPMFTILVPDVNDRQARAFTTLLQTHDGAIWCGTRRGLFRLTQTSGRLELIAVGIKLSKEGAESSQINTLLEDRHRTLWIGTPNGLYRRRADGAAVRYGKTSGLPDDHIHDLLEDREGNLWVGTRVGGLVRLANGTVQEPLTITNIYNVKSGFIADWIFDLFESSDGRLWAGTNRGLAEFAADKTKGEAQSHLYTRKNGFIYHEISNVAEDRDGNLWLGSHAGAMKWAREGFVTYGEQEGFLAINAIFGDQSHVICFRSYVLGDKQRSVFEGAKLDLLRATDTYHLRYGCFDGQAFNTFTPAVPTSGNFGWVGEGVTLQTRNGEWWLGTGEGLYRFPASDNFLQVKTARPLAAYSTKEGMTGSQQVFRIFEDSRGDIWASTVAAPNGLARWDHTSGNFNRDLAESPGLPSANQDLALSFGEDVEGNVWIGFGTGLARYRQGQFTFFNSNQGLPLGAIQNIYSDRTGRLWLASARSGLIQVKHPGSDRPIFESYSLMQGLSSNRADVITEDLEDRIYVGTGRGLDRLDPETGRVKHFTTADGLASGEMLSAYCDRDGALWFGTSNGLSRLAPRRETSIDAPPPILITRLKVSGESQPVSALGEVESKLPELTADRNQLQIDFVGLSFAPGDVLRYQYQLEGTNANWSEPSEQRTVNFVNIAPGQYRFLVRAVNSDGVVSLAPAVVTFVILRPVWQRWWFLLLAAFTLGLVVYALYRYRVARLLEVANMRTRIATDLHDDIGANLTKIAILSEVARHQLGNGDAVRDRPLSSIARISRESVASMSDIVWAINPQRDTLRDLARRIRQHAEEVCLSQNIEVIFSAPSREPHFRLGVDLRRDLYLIFKEATTNSLRHSECTRLEIELAYEKEVLALTIVDNGKGFDPGGEEDGNGLINMRRRAERHAGEMVIDSQPGRGTTIKVRLPYARSRRPLPT